MLLPEFCEELFYTSNLNLFESNFKIYLQKVDEYSFLETQSFLKRLNKNYSIKQLKKLEILDLSTNQLTSIPNLNLSNLQQLYLYNNQLTKLLTLTLLPKLKWLFLKYTNLTELPTLNLPNLQMLDLSYNQLTKIQNLNLLNLQMLDLSWNKLSEIPNITLPNLETLDLSHNKLTKIPNLTLFPKLQILHIRDNPLTKQSKEYVRSLKFKSLIFI